MIASLFFLILRSFMPSICEANYYTAAVLEHARRGDISVDTPKEIIQKNLQVYILAGKIAASRGADIIVFPEFGIYPTNDSRKVIRPYLETIPNPDENQWNPCIQNKLFNNSEILSNLSCLAKNNNIVVVANMGEYQPCIRKEENKCSVSPNIKFSESYTKNEDDQCPEDGAFHYNTNVVFDRDGNLIDRYRKIHLFFEPAFNAPALPKYSKFETDFGSFTTFVCFDIIFKDSVNAVEQTGINNAAFPTWWFNELPGYSSIQMMESWALGNKINVLGANINLPRVGSVGSGIFSGHHGPIKYTFNPDGQSKLLIAKVPQNADIPVHYDDGEMFIIKEQEVIKTNDDGDTLLEICSGDILGFERNNEYRCLQTNTSQYTLRKLENNSSNIKACNNGMCCSLNYTAVSLEDEFYLAVFNGTFNARDYYFWCEEICQLIRCNSHDDKPCSVFPTTSKTIFTQIQLEAKFSTSYIYPSLISTGMRMVPLTKWNFKQEQNSATLKTEDTSDLYLFVRLLGRCYSRDPPYKP